MRVRHIVKVRIARDTDMARKQFYDDDTLTETIIDTYQRQANADLSIETSQTEALSFGDVDAVKGIYLEVDGDAKVYLNSSSDAIQLRVGTSVAKLFIECDIASVSVENTSGSATLTGVYAVWGDPTP